MKIQFVSISLLSFAATKKTQSRCVTTSRQFFWVCRRSRPPAVPSSTLPVNELVDLPGSGILRSPDIHRLIKDRSYSTWTCVLPNSLWVCMNVTWSKTLHRFKSVKVCSLGNLVLSYPIESGIATKATPHLPTTTTATTTETLHKK